MYSGKIFALFHPILSRVKCSSLIYNLNICELRKIMEIMSVFQFFIIVKFCYKFFIEQNTHFLVYKALSFLGFSGDGWS